MGGRIALLIGSGSYGVDALQQLHAPASDVRELALVLGDPYAGGFDSVIELIDASTQQVGREIARTLDRCKRDDMVLLYFSGHALLDDEGQLHLAMRDTEPDLLSPTSISAAFVAGEFDRSRSRRQLVILDCCAGTGFAHGTSEALPLAAPDAPRVASAFYAEGQPRAVFAACRRGTDSARPHSRFTHALIQGLRGAADGDGDGRISIDDLARYLEPHASAWLGEAVGSLLIANTMPRASSPPRAARAPHPGGLISDRYRIQSVLAERGIGVLCAAIDERNGRPVSVKYLRSPDTSEGNTLQRFLREAGVAGAIGHPNLLTIRDVGFERSTAFIVMDPLAGESLAALLREQERLDLRETVEIVLQASAGVAAAHAQRLVHRDLNPEHIFVGRNPDGTVGQVKVLGFGASTLLDANDVALAGALIGSPHYMAPEQVLGAGPPDVRADVYSLGAIMYQALTGHRPFEAENYGALLFKISNEVPPMPSSWAPDLPAALEAIVIQAMARDPANRFADVEALQDVLYEAGVTHGWLQAIAAPPPPIAAEPHAVEQPVNTPIVFDLPPRSALAPEPRRWPVVLGVTAALVAGAAAWLLYTPPPAGAPGSQPSAASAPREAVQPEPTPTAAAAEPVPSAPAPAAEPAQATPAPAAPAPAPMAAPSGVASADPLQPAAAEAVDPDAGNWRVKLRAQAEERRAAREARIQARLEAEEAARQARAEVLAKRAAEREARVQAAALAKQERAEIAEAEQLARAEAAAQKEAERQARKQERAQAAEAARQARKEAAAQAAAVRAATRAANPVREPAPEPPVLAVQAQPAPDAPDPGPARLPAQVKPLPDAPPAPTPPPQP